MDILYLLIPLSAVLILVIVGIFGWAIHSGQFDDVEREGERPLMDEVEARAGDEGTSTDSGQGEQSRVGDNRNRPG
jgi:cbb3-type cytochrome oxidase maturation protein